MPTEGQTEERREGVNYSWVGGQEIEFRIKKNDYNAEYM